MPKRIYLESSVHIAYLKEEAERADTIEAVLRKSQEKAVDIEFVTSTISLVEVDYITGLADTLEEDIARIDLYWTHVPIKFIEVNKVNAEQARSLIRYRARNNPHPQIAGARKRASDALHLATAIALPCDDFWTYDTKDFVKYGTNQITISEPYAEQLGLPFSGIQPQ
jgi:predicted nucleic acid-binding protein